MSQSKAFGENLMRNTPYGVRVEGVDVVMTVGHNASFRLTYDVALNLATFLYHCGKVAKRAAGDQGMRLIGIADLTDATADEMQAQRSRDGTAVLARVPSSRSRR